MIKKIYDLIGIGIGPFNLGLAALANDCPELQCLFIDDHLEFNWHAGVLLPTARMQVPYYADLVSLINPCSRFAYFNYLHAHHKLFSFGIHDHAFPLRIEYNQYCRWVAGQLPSLHFGRQCEKINHSTIDDCFVISCWNKVLRKEEIFHAKHIVLGTGTIPALPKECPDHQYIFHSANYLFRKQDLFNKKRVTIIGSGQSAAEIFYDLLGHSNQLDEINWFTQSSRFAPMDFSKLTLELSTPAYINYFYELKGFHKTRALKEQQYLYKGINHTLIDAIYDELYVQRANGTKCNIHIGTNCSLVKMETSGELITIGLHQHESRKHTLINTDVLILATGYRYEEPAFLSPIQPFIQRNEEGKYAVQHNYSIDRHNTIFIQNAEQHTHGFNSADLGLGPFRNAVILNTIMRKEVFALDYDDIFQSFDIPGSTN